MVDVLVQRNMKNAKAVYTEKEIKIPVKQKLIDKQLASSLNRQTQCKKSLNKDGSC